uniref:Uncharacterized protein n=1 Tax=viral metagenome TaxID=1070528 RepID=A0A6H1ZI86_9ZZZZ
MLTLTCDECGQHILTWQTGKGVKKPPTVDLFTTHLCNKCKQIHELTASETDKWKQAELERIEFEYQKKFNEIKKKFKGENLK